MKNPRNKALAAVLIAALALALMASCGGASFSIPSRMIGTYEGDAGTIRISSNDIVYEPTGGSTGIDFRNIFDMASSQYEISSTDTSFAFYMRRMPNVGYWFTLSGDTLTMRISSTTTSTTTYTKVS